MTNYDIDLQHAKRLIVDHMNKLLPENDYDVGDIVIDFDRVTEREDAKIEIDARTSPIIFHIRDTSLSNGIKRLLADLAFEFSPVREVSIFLKFAFGMIYPTIMLIFALTLVPDILLKYQNPYPWPALVIYSAAVFPAELLILIKEKRSKKLKKDRIIELLKKTDVFTSEELEHYSTMYVEPYNLDIALLFGVSIVEFSLLVVISFAIWINLIWCGIILKDKNKSYSMELYTKSMK